MKKVAVIILTMALLTLCVVVPVMAVPKADSPAWYKVPVTDTFYVVTYDQLTELCLAAGLQKNPYPAPTTPTEESAYPLYSLYGASEYYVFTFTIGDEVYQGVSCTTYDMTVNVVTGEGHMVYQATHYIGDLGKMNHGFVGPCTVDLHGYYYTASFVLQGFGKFNKQSMVLTMDSRLDGTGFASGYVLVLGNRYK